VIRKTIGLLQLLLWLTVILPPASGFLLAYYLRFESGLIPFLFGLPQTTPYLLLFAVMMITWLLAVGYFRLLDLDLLREIWIWQRRALAATAIPFSAIVLLLFFQKLHVSRLFVVILICLHVIFLFVLHRVVMGWMQYLRARGKGPRALVLGSGPLAERVADWLRATPTMACQVVGPIALHVDRAEMWKLDRISESCDEIIVSVPLSELAVMKPVLAKLKKLDVPTRVVLDIGEYCESPHTFEIAGLPVVSLSSYHRDQLNDIIGKRILDVVFAACVLVVASPLYAAIAVAILLRMGRPIFFVQERVGLNGKRFRMWKFRTMALAEPERCESEWTVANHPRVTKLGKFLRKYNLDELPQFMNVLRGEMSVVGPRPERPYFVKQFSEKLDGYRIRHQFQAGITGWAQVNGLRQDTPIDERLKYDLYYMENWSLWFDIKIIFLTVL
jgi:exopolysaccharide biosynthesis polyprenyl glycosylphosphotransferase